jgi:hypothetical protein
LAHYDAVVVGSSVVAHGWWLVCQLGFKMESCGGFVLQQLMALA